MSATLRLTRNVGSSAPELRRGRFEILVDDKSVGSLANHDTVETQIEPGRHNLVLRKGRYSSRTLTLEPPTVRASTSGVAGPGSGRPTSPRSSSPTSGSA